MSESDIDKGTEQVLNKLENICKDRFSGYMFVLMDGDNAYTCYSSGIMALGACEYIRDVVQKKWNE